MSKEHQFCSVCINPSNLGIINPETGRELVFYQHKEGAIICDICSRMFKDYSLPERAWFDNEFEEFLQANKRILFAYSGGLDSTVVLSKLSPICRKRGIELLTFTINTSVKGQVAKNNIKNVLSYLGILENHFYRDIDGTVHNHPKIIDLVDKPATTLEIYRKCREKNILPCGPICNAMMDGIYREIMAELDFDTLVTGGDTPKKNTLQKYSLYWKKSSGITIFRGGYAFGLSKDINRRYVVDNNIPWIDPRCGGYDTDCLIPGVFFSDGLDNNAQQDLETVIEKYPIILEYLSERVRFGVIDRNEAIERLTKVDIADQSCYLELLTILENKE
ncbi:hypothetical protein COT93_03260 [Candidatus Falkowbacteria bacterium CG10_big_fil_rev_8_21_14_0_10_37_18]|uniref:Uncharacterized protein n=1 Tax=Candidatus Falkowbacteria bacterium CG10_big_fil_rev_8_21_14_0_10_37_18 TaxID=1974562 RepID=A0A2H0V849_9BACT|nr:hypothetical protein [Candidatus Falkowbacteria bacterium]OIO06299.1 MAG: hypothetical protein AUJ26_01040 [Candidatus Falkowbacteria bacterium CG1_02_37_21]PIR95284.1 MAG: hypothetical protein COT93_03260 [Candidatus Falkowbacteria bacterium CG10_big_fil_rev_8_21_14_0_10_37_18]